MLDSVSVVTVSIVQTDTVELEAEDGMGVLEHTQMVLVMMIEEVEEALDTSTLLLRHPIILQGVY